MKNSEEMSLTLTRRDVCDIKLALTGIICDMRTELKSEGTNRDRKEILERSIEKWMKLRIEIGRQFAEQDKN